MASLLQANLTRSLESELHVTIYELALPEDERESARFCEGNLMLLIRETQKFASALSLFEFAHGCGKSDWAMIAGREGAVTLYNCDKIVDSFGELFARSPNLKSLIDQVELSSARKCFKKAFPHADAIRNGVTHFEIMTTPERREKNRSKKPYESNRIKTAGGTLYDVLDGRRYLTTINGNIIGYELASESLEILQATVRGHWRALVAASEKTRTMLFRQAERHKN